VGFSARADAAADSVADAGACVLLLVPHCLRLRLEIALKLVPVIATQRESYRVPGRCSGTGAEDSAGAGAEDSPGADNGAGADDGAGADADDGASACAGAGTLAGAGAGAGASAGCCAKTATDIVAPTSAPWRERFGIGVLCFNKRMAEFVDERCAPRPSLGLCA
jgi:hypothetical protein